MKQDHSPIKSSENPVNLEIQKHVHNTPTITKGERFCREKEDRDRELEIVAGGRERRERGGWSATAGHRWPLTALAAGGPQIEEREGGERNRDEREEKREEGKRGCDLERENKGMRDGRPAWLANGGRRQF